MSILQGRRHLKKHTVNTIDRRMNKLHWILAVLLLRVTNADDTSKFSDDGGEVHATGKMMEYNPQEYPWETGDSEPLENMSELQDKNCWNKNNRYHCLCHDIPLKRCTEIPEVPQCFTCMDKAYHKNQTVCYAVNRECLYDLFHGLSDTIDNLQLIIINNWEGFLPLTPDPIDLAPLKKFRRMKYFRLMPCFEYFLQAFPITYENDTFKNLGNMSHFFINIPTLDQSFVNMVKHMPQLTTLDLSYTRGISTQNIVETISAVNNGSLRYLYLTAFQCVGCNGYNSTIHLSILLSNKVFPELKELVLSENSVSRMSPGIFGLTPNLIHFDISDNLLLDSHNDALFIEAMIHPTLESFTMAYQGYVGSRQIHGQRQILQEAQQHETVATTAASPLTIFSLKANSFQYIVGCVNDVTSNETRPANFSEMFSLSTSQNKRLLYNFFKCVLPIQFDEGPDPEALSELREVLNVSCSLFLQIPFGPNLQTIHMNQLHWEATQTLGVTVGQDWCFKENNLTEFIFTENSYWIEAAKLQSTISNIKSVSGLEHLVKLNISNNRMNISLNLVTDQSFFPQLEGLYISDNRFLLSTEFRLCQKATTLKYLDFSGNGLGQTKEFPTEFLKGCSKLVHLDLSRNQLHNIRNMFYVNITTLSSLTRLNLRDNQLTNLSTDMTAAIDKISQKVPKLYIDLTGNPLICNCDTLNFTTWMIHHAKQYNSTVKFKGFHSYKCININSNLMSMHLITDTMIQKFRTYCSPPDKRTPIIIEAVGSTLAFVIFIYALIMIYRVRWRIRYKIFRFRQQIARSLHPHSEEGDSTSRWKYDAFVSYCVDDRFWVHGNFMKILEQKYGFNLCLRYRDFTPGGTITETILENIKASREIIIIISDAALKNGWNNFELEHSTLQSNHRRQRLIIIKMGELHNLAHSALAANLLDVHGYLEWSEDKSKEKLFWEMLVQKMYQQKNRGVCSSLCCLRRRGYVELYDSSYM